MNYLNRLQYIKLLGLIYKYPKSSINNFVDILNVGILNKKISPFPRIITFYATNRCNLNCAMCLNSVYRQKNIGHNDLELKTVKKILPELIKHKPFVAFTGGEPLLNKDIFKIISLLSSKGIFTSLTSNGFVLENYAKKIVDSKLEFISLSLDHYIGKKHNLGRGVNGSYENLIRGLTKLISLKKTTPSNIKINTVINKNNFRDLSKMYDFIETFGIDEWSLQHYNFLTPKVDKAIDNFKFIHKYPKYNEGSLINKNYYFTPKEIKILAKQLEEIVEKSQRYRTKLSVKPNFDNIYSYYKEIIPTKKSNCTFPFNALNVFEGSRVCSCLGYEIGDLKKNNTIHEMWRSPKMRDFQNNILRNKILPPCFRCCGLNYIFNK